MVGLVEVVVVLGRSPDTSVGKALSVMVTRVEAEFEPPAPMAVAVKVVDCEGLTAREPAGGTLPKSVIVTRSALVEFQRRVVLWPRSMALWSALMVIVGAVARDV